MSSRYFCETCPWARLSSALAASAPIAQMREVIEDIGVLARKRGSPRRRGPPIRETGPLCKLCVRVMGRNAVLTRELVALRKEAVRMERDERIAGLRADQGRRDRFERRAKQLVHEVEASMDAGEAE